MRASSQLASDGNPCARARGDPLPRCRKPTSQSRGRFPLASCASAASEAEREVYGRLGTSALPERPCQQTNQLDGASGGVVCSQRLGVAAVEVEGGVVTRPDASRLGSRPREEPPQPCVPLGTSAALSPPLKDSEADLPGRLAPQRRAVPSRARLTRPRRSAAPPLCSTHPAGTAGRRSGSGSQSRSGLAVSSQPFANCVRKLGKAGCRFLPLALSTCWGGVGTCQLPAQPARREGDRRPLQASGILASASPSAAREGCPAAHLPALWSRSSHACPALQQKYHLCLLFVTR